MEGGDYVPTSSFLYFATLIGARLVRHMVAENLCRQMQMYDVY